MGEIAEIITVANQQPDIFFKITSGSLRFQVQGGNNAGISLTRRPNRSSKFWIVIGYKGRTFVLKGNKPVYSVRTPYRPLHQYAEFWLLWHDDVITLGTGDSDKPYLVYEVWNTCGLHFITFATIGKNVESLRWRFEVPPVLEKVGIKAISAGALEWKAVDDRLPDGALIGGFEYGQPLYIIRAEHDGSLIPGKFVPSEGLAYVPWERDLHEKTKFEVLCGYNCVWVPCSDGKIPAGAVRAGYSAASGEALYVGRASHNDDIVPGPIHPSHRIFFMAILDCYPNATDECEILVEPNENMHCANPFLMYDTRLHKTNREYSYIEDYSSDEDQISL